MSQLTTSLVSVDAVVSVGFEVEEGDSTDPEVFVSSEVEEVIEPFELSVVDPPELEEPVLELVVVDPSDPDEEELERLGSGLSVVEPSEPEEEVVPLELCVEADDSLEV